MASPTLPTLQQLDRLNRSSPDFQDQLGTVLSGKEYKRCVLNLQGDNLIWLVNYLDEVLDGIDPSSAAFRKCLRELGSICGNKGILPRSYRFSSDLNIDPDPLAGGGYGVVYKGTVNGSIVCVKRVRVYAQEDPRKAKKAFCQEAVMWKRLTHPNLIPFLGATTTPLQLISDWMSGGDLRSYIKHNPDAGRLGLLSDVAKGLCYLHSCNVVHRDLKGENILVDNIGRARIADFGLTAVTQNPDSVGTISYHDGYTAQWAAPEVLLEGTLSKEGDMFAFAMVMIEVFTGSVPFTGCRPAKAMLEIMEGRRPPRPTHPTFTEVLWTLMQHCWDPDPYLRPEASEALEILTRESLAQKQLPLPNISDHDLPTRIKSRSQSRTILGGILPNDQELSFPPSPEDQQEPLQELERNTGTSDPGIDGVLPPTPRKISSEARSTLGFVGGLQDNQERDAGNALGRPSDLKILISHPLTTHEHVSLITTIFSDNDRPEVDRNLSRDDYQTVIDIMDEALDSLSPQIRRRCLRFLCRICGHQALLPTTLSIPLSYDVGEAPQFRGGFADVWKGQSDGRDVAVKILRVYPSSGYEQIIKRFCKEVMIWKTLHHPNVLPLLGAEITETRFAMVSEWMKNGTINDFLKRVDADRLELLAEVARGLIYIHSRGVIHGDLKGANVGINHSGHACILDFGLVFIIPDEVTSLSTRGTNGTIRWMSPELFAPEMFGLRENRPTKESDCYALGMVIYEVLSGHAPWFGYKDFLVMRVVLDGERPERPQGAWFTDGIWEMLELCWKPQPSERISAETVLLCLEGTPSPPRPVASYHLNVIAARDSSVSIASRVTIPNSTGLPTARVDDGPQVPPPGSLSVTSLAIPQNSGELRPDQPQTGNSEWERSVEWLARGARRIFKATSRKLKGLRQSDGSI